MSLEIEDTEGLETEQQEPSIRDSIMESVEQHAEPVADAEPAEKAAPAEIDPNESVSERAARERDEAGRFKKGEEKPKPTEKPKPGEKAAQEKPGEKPAAAADKPFKGPQSWKPAAREALAKAPPEVQQEVMRREREITTRLQQGAEDTRIASNLKQLMQPYEAFIRAENSNAFQAIDNMMRTAVGLRTLPAVDKARMVAEICHQFSVDPGHLEEAWLALRAGGRPAQQPQPRPQPQQMRDPRLDPLIARLEEREQAEYEEIRSEQAKFADSHPFFGDVRHDMADIVELRGKRGLATDLDTAYDLACRAHPDVAPLYEQQRAAERAARGNSSTQRARAAASSVRPSRGAGVQQAADPSDLRSLIAEQMAAQRG